LSMEDPSTIRSAVVGAAIGGAPYDGDSLAGQMDGRIGEPAIGQRRPIRN
jgi:hypothetical protein